MAATAAIISAAIAATAAAGSAIGSAINNKKAKEEELRAYERARTFLNSEYYRDPLSSVSNRALLNRMDEMMQDQVDAIDNRSEAGGATMENRLAARNAANKAIGGMYANILQGEYARRMSIQQQMMQLDQQHSANVQNNYLQNAQNWQQWGAQTSNAALNYGKSTLVNK